MPDPLDLSVVIPIFNEQDSLPELVARTLAACRSTGAAFELVLVDDGSADASPRWIAETAQAEPEVVGVLLGRNVGQHAAITAGFETSRGAAVVTLDADLQNPPEEIPRLLAKIAEGYDTVGTVRVPREDSLFRRTASGITNRIVQRSTGILMHDYGCMLRAYSRPVVDAILACHERHTFIPVLANSFARRTAEIEVAHERRKSGASKYSLGRLVRLQLDLLTSMTTFPLRVLTLSGVALAFLGFAFGVALLVARLWLGAKWAADGVFTLFAALFLFLGAQLFGMGLLGEYVGRIYDQVRSRPRYVIQDVVRRGDVGSGNGGSGEAKTAARRPLTVVGAGGRS